MTGIAAAPPLRARSVRARARKRDGPVPRVLFVEPNDDGTTGGSHRVLHDFAMRMDRTRYEPVALFYQENRYVAPLRQAGVAVHVWNARWSHERQAVRGRAWPVQAQSLLAAVAVRARFLSRERIALVHVNGTPQSAHDDWRPAARMLGLPAIANCAVNLRFDVRHGLQRWLMGSFDRVLPVSQHVARQVSAFGYPESRIVTIHPGIDVAGFRSRVCRAANVVRSELATSPEQLLVLMVGNVRQWKGQHVAIEAITKLPSALRESVRLVFAGAAATGDTGYERGLRARVDEAGLGAQVSFLGHRDDVADLMAAADVVLHASVEPEPFGLVLIEGMALGRVVVASRFGGPSEILDATSGITFAPGDADELAAVLARQITEPAARAELGRQARSRAERFDIGGTVNRTMRVYDHLLARDARRGKGTR